MIFFESIPQNSNVCREALPPPRRLRFYGIGWREILQRFHLTSGLLLPVSALELGILLLSADIGTLTAVGVRVHVDHLSVLYPLCHFKWFERLEFGLAFGCGGYLHDESGGNQEILRALRAIFLDCRTAWKHDPNTQQKNDETGQRSLLHDFNPPS